MSDDDYTAIGMINDRLNRMENKLDMLIEFRFLWLGRISTITFLISCVFSSIVVIVKVLT